MISQLHCYLWKKSDGAVVTGYEKKMSQSSLLLTLAFSRFLSFEQEKYLFCHSYTDDTVFKCAKDDLQFMLCICCFQQIVGKTLMDFCIMFFFSPASSSSQLLSALYEQKMSSQNCLPTLLNSLIFILCNLFLQKAL